MTTPAPSRLRVYNTLTRELDDFQPNNPKRVNMFVCGPTVYDSSHIGHGKTYAAYDIIARYLRHIGYSVFFVLNITDIDDRIINRAHQNKEDPLQLSERQAQAFYKDMKDLHVNGINLYAKAGDYVYTRDVPPAALKGDTAVVELGSYSVGKMRPKAGLPTSSTKAAP